MKNKLRASYTLLSLWRKGRYQEAVDFYMKKPITPTKAMQDGIRWDNYACDFINKYALLPPEFGDDTLTDPYTQLKVEASFDAQTDLVGVYDTITRDTLYEFKTGSSKDSADYANDFQIAVYLLLAERKGIKVNRAIIAHYDQHTNTKDRSLIWNTPQERERGANFIASLAPDIFTYFSSIGIISP